MEKSQKKRSVLARLRNNFIAGVVVLIPIGITSLPDIIHY